MELKTINSALIVEMTMPADQTERNRLEARKEELAKRLVAIQRDLGRGLEHNLEEQAIQLENLEVLEEISRVAEQELRDVELKLAALNRTP
jgi:hypothetical protein